MQMNEWMLDKESTIRFIFQIWTLPFDLAIQRGYSFKNIVRIVQTDVKTLSVKMDCRGIL